MLPVIQLRRTLTADTHNSQWSFPRVEPVTVIQRLGFLCHSTPNWWVPFCVEGPVSTGEGKNSWLPKWPFLISVRWWWHSVGREAHPGSLQVTTNSCKGPISCIPRSLNLYLQNTCILYNNSMTLDYAIIYLAVIQPNTQRITWVRGQYHNQEHSPKTVKGYKN